jgi:hypothetical protein
MVHAVLSAHDSMNADRARRGKPPHRLTPAGVAETVATMLREGAPPERIEVHPMDDNNVVSPLSWNVLGDAKVNRTG